MKRLFHSFMRPFTRSHRSIVPTGDRDHELSFHTLELILKYGLVCTPEQFPLFADAASERPAKVELLNQNIGYDTISQSRACFTLLDSLELAQEYRPSDTGPEEYWSHADLFGEFAIGLDPIEARDLGILPVVYTYRHTTFNRELPSSGLGSQVVHRLDEMRTLLAILSRVESANGLRCAAPWEMLRPLMSVLRYEPKIDRKLQDLSPADAETVFEFFDTDRIAAWNLADIVTILLSLYQTTDSTFADAPLAFFQQREWRLVHHVRLGTEWYSLGDHEEYRDPLMPKYEDARSEINDHVSDVWQRRQKDPLKYDWFRNHCWVIAKIDGKPFRDFVREIIVPSEFECRTKAILEQLPFQRKPAVSPLAEPWRIQAENGQPKIVHQRRTSPRDET